MQQKHSQRTNLTDGHMLYYLEPIQRFSHEIEAKLMAAFRKVSVAVGTWFLVAPLLGLPGLLFRRIPVYPDANANRPKKGDNQDGAHHLILAE